VDQFKALLVTRDEATKKQSVAETMLTPDELMPGDVDIRVEYSTVNYKDGLAITGRLPVVRRFPMIPGVDLAGTVIASGHEGVRAGDRVIVNGWGLGETHYGAYSQMARVDGRFITPLPPEFTTAEAMAIGTAGYTAMLCVLALERHGLQAGDGEVLVTGATGGVGSVATALLARLGYRVIAATGKAAEADYLRSLGAADVIDRAELAAPGKPLQKERWAAAVDAVGSHTLANACAQTRYGGVVAACGLAQGADLPATVMPFILRGVTLAGVDSVMAPQPLRREAWQRLARDLDPQRLETITTEVPLAQAIARAQDLMAGKLRGRVVVTIE